MHGEALPRNSQYTCVLIGIRMAVLVKSHELISCTIMVQIPGTECSYAGS